MKEAPEVAQVVMDANTISTIINNINSLYANALNHIIALTIGLLTLGGVVFPLIIAYFQKKRANADHRKLTAQIVDEINAAKAELVLGMAKELEKEKEIFEQRIVEIQKNIELQMLGIKAGANAKTHHHVATTSVQNKHYVEALSQCRIAICDYVKAKDEKNLQIVLDIVLQNSVLPNLKKTDFDKDDCLGGNIDQIIQSVETINENGRYANSIASLTRAYKTALARTN